MGSGLVLCEKGLILIYKDSFYFDFIKIWNSLPAKIIQSTNLKIIIIYNYLTILTVFCTTKLNFGKNKHSMHIQGPQPIKTISKDIEFESSI